MVEKGVGGRWGGRRERQEYTNRLLWGLGNKGEREHGERKIRWRATEGRDGRFNTERHVKEILGFR